MALLDDVSAFSNSTVCTKWANGKLGEIVPTNGNKYVFIEHEYVERELVSKVKYEDIDNCPVVACGFVFFWLRLRKRKKKLATIFSSNQEGKTPKEIYDEYIDARKTWFLDTMKNRADAWRYSDLEKLFYEQSLTFEGELDLIGKSEPLLDYLDEEDKAEFIDVMKNFLSYVESIVELYKSPCIALPDNQQTSVTNHGFTINEEYRADIESVFLETFRCFDMEWKTYPQVIEAATHCLDPNQPTQIPVFLEACISRRCARTSARQSPQKVVNALVGLDVLKYNDKSEYKKACDSVSRKLKRMNPKQMSDADKILYDNILVELCRKVDDND